jgi:hypothetical protein
MSHQEDQISEIADPLRDALAQLDGEYQVHINSVYIAIKANRV